jgi:hypothetical protein
MCEGFLAQAGSQAGRRRFRVIPHLNTCKAQRLGIFYVPLPCIVSTEAKSLLSTELFGFFDLILKISGFRATLNFLILIGGLISFVVCDQKSGTEGIAETVRVIHLLMLYKMKVVYTRWKKKKKDKKKEKDKYKDKDKDKNKNKNRSQVSCRHLLFCSRISGQASS